MEGGGKNKKDGRREGGQGRMKNRRKRNKR